MLSRRQKYQKIFPSGKSTSGRSKFGATSPVLRCIRRFQDGSGTTVPTTVRRRSASTSIATAAIDGSLPPFCDAMQHRLNQARCCLSVSRQASDRPPLRRMRATSDSSRRPRRFPPQPAEHWRAAVIVIPDEPGVIGGAIAGFLPGSNRGAGRHARPRRDEQHLGERRRLKPARALEADVIGRSTIETGNVPDPLGRDRIWPPGRTRSAMRSGSRNRRRNLYRDQAFLRRRRRAVCAGLFRPAPDLRAAAASPGTAS
jgi:hypothetical protein